MIIGPYDLVGNSDKKASLKVNLANNGALDLPSNSAGFGLLLVGDLEEFSQFIWDSSENVNLVTSSTNVVATDSAGSICIFDNTGKVTIKNRLGSIKKIALTYWINI